MAYYAVLAPMRFRIGLPDGARLVLLVTVQVPDRTSSLTQLEEEST